MSHTTTMGVEIIDLDALAAAVSEYAGAEFMRGQQTHRYYGGVSPCDHAIRVRGVNYEVGVVRQPNGNYRLVLDGYSSVYGSEHDGGKLIALFGENCSKLSQSYAVHAVTRTMKKQGYLVARKQGQNGATRLVVTGVR